jgi:hypothetical protein
LGALLQVAAHIMAVVLYRHSRLPGSSDQALTVRHHDFSGPEIIMTPHQTPPPTHITHPEPGIPPRTEYDFLGDLSSALGALGIQCHRAGSAAGVPKLTVVSPAGSLLNETVACQFRNGRPTFTYSWGDVVTGDTITEIAQSLARVVTVENAEYGVATR